MSVCVVAHMRGHLFHMVIFTLTGETQLWFSFFWQTVRTDYDRRTFHDFPKLEESFSEFPSARETMWCHIMLLACAFSRARWIRPLFNPSSGKTQTDSKDSLWEKQRGRDLRSKSIIEIVSHLNIEILRAFIFHLPLILSPTSLSPSPLSPPSFQRRTGWGSLKSV